MIIIAIACASIGAGLTQDDLNLPFNRSAVANHTAETQVASDPGNFRLMSEDGYRSFWSPHFVNLDGAVAFEFWPPERLDLNLFAVRVGDELAIVTSRQNLSYAASSGEKLATIETDITPISAETYKSLTVLAAKRTEGQRWTAIMKTDIDQLGKPSSVELWRFEGIYASRALLDRKSQAVVFKSQGEWHLRSIAASPKQFMLPGGFEPWAVDVAADIVIGQLGTGLAFVEVSTELTETIIQPPASASGKATTFFSAALLGGGRAIVCFRTVETGDPEGGRVSLYEADSAGKLKLLGPFELQGASTTGNVLLLGRGVRETGSLVVWPRQ